MAVRRKSIDRALVKRLTQARDDVQGNISAWKASIRQGEFTPEIEELWRETRERLLDNLGVLKQDVHRLTGKRFVPMSAVFVDMWDGALAPHLLDFRPEIRSRRINLLQQLDIAIREALSLARAGERTETETPATVLRVFISHGGRTPARAWLEKFIRALGAEPVVVEDEPNLGLTPSGKVQREIELSHFGIVLVTLERAATQDDRPHPRGNIVDERARLAAELGNDRVFIALEAGMSLPSNIMEYVRARFSEHSMDEVATQLVTELRALGLLRAEGKSVKS
jgi:predicted nucleotide-binding protein